MSPSSNATIQSNKPLTELQLTQHQLPIPATLIQNYMANEKEIDGISKSAKEINHKERNRTCKRKNKKCKHKGNSRGSVIDTVNRRDRRLKDLNYDFQTLKSLTQNYFTNLVDSKSYGGEGMGGENTLERNLKKIVKIRKLSLDLENKCNLMLGLTNRKVRRNSMPENHSEEIINVNDKKGINIEVSHNLNITVNPSSKTKSTRRHLRVLNDILKQYDSTPMVQTNNTTTPTPSSSNATWQMGLYKKRRTEAQNHKNNKRIIDNLTNPPCRIVSLGEIILSAKDLPYNGCELSDPINLMNLTFFPSLPPSNGCTSFRRMETMKVGEE